MRNRRFLGPSLFMASTALFVSAIQQAQSYTLQVTLAPQQGSYLCWAASLNLLFSTPPVTTTSPWNQCSLAQQQVSGINCCSGGTSSAVAVPVDCDKPAWPMPRTFLKPPPSVATPWTYSSSPGPHEWNDAVNTLIAGVTSITPRPPRQPFMFSIRYLDWNGNPTDYYHIMSVYGYSIVANDQGGVDSLLMVYDPLGPGLDGAGVGIGEAYWLAYPAYLAGEDHRNNWYVAGPSWFDFR